MNDFDGSENKSLLELSSSQQTWDTLRNSPAAVGKLVVGNVQITVQTNVLLRGLSSVLLNILFKTPCSATRAKLSVDSPGAKQSVIQARRNKICAIQAFQERRIIYCLIWWIDKREGYDGARVAREFLR